MWDEKKGPKILDSYPPCDLDLESMTLQILPAFQCIFGHKGEIQYDRTQLLLPMKNHKKIAKIMLNSKPDSNIRGGFLPIFTVLLFPLELLPEYTHYFTMIQDMMITSFITQDQIKLADYIEELNTTTDWAANDLLQQAESAKKAKKYSYAAELFENTIVLANLGSKKNLSRKAASELDNARELAAQEIITNVQSNIKNNRIDQAIVQLDKAISIALATGNKKIIKKVQDNVDKRLVEVINALNLEIINLEKDGERSLFKEAERKLNHMVEIIESRGTANVHKEMRNKVSLAYSRWAIVFFERGLEELKDNQLSMANRSLTNALKFAQKTNDERLVLKIQDQLVKVPNP
jgi:hypothetical protein